MTHEITEDLSNNLSQQDKLDVLFYQFAHLYDQWTQDRELEIKQNAELSALVKSFTMHVNAFGTLEKKVRNDLDDAIKESVNKSITSNLDKIGKDIGTIAATSINNSIKELGSSVRIAKDGLAHYAQYQEAITLVNTRGWLSILIGAIVIGIGCAAIVLNVYVPQKIEILSDQQVGWEGIGENVQNAYDKTKDPKKRQALLDLISGVDSPSEVKAPVNKK